MPFPFKFSQSDHPIRPDLRSSDNISWPGGGQGNKWILSCVFKAISHSLSLPLFLRRALDICVARLWGFPGAPLPHLLLWNSNKNTFTGEPSFISPASTHLESRQWRRHMLFSAWEDSHCSAVVKQTANCWRENKPTIMGSRDHFCDILME